MAFKHIFDPTKGMFTAKQSSGIPPEYSPHIKGCYLLAGEVRSDFGMTNYPVPGVTKTNALLGCLMKIAQFHLLNGTTYLIALTTRYIYQYNTVTSTWDVVIQGTVIEDCEDAWSTTGIGESTAVTTPKMRGSNAVKIVTPTTVAPTLLLHCDGTDTSTTFTDSSAGAKTVTAVGNAQIDTAQSEFGGASGLFDGTGDYLTLVDSSDWDLFIDTFTSCTIDMWFKLASTSDDTLGHMFHGADATHYWALYQSISSGTSTVSFDVDVAGSNNQTTFTWTADTNWHHIAVVKIGGVSSYTIKIFLDGVLKVTSSAFTGVINTSGLLIIGNNVSHTIDYNGWLDEIRIVKGTAVWTSGFLIPTIAYTSNGLGILAYENMIALDISAAANTHLSFWIRATTNITSDTLRIRLSEQNAGGVGASYADYTIPAIIADTWQHISLAIATPVTSSGGGTFPTDLNALLSVALIVNSSISSTTIYIDDVRTAKEFTGTADNRFSTTVISNTIIITNGIDLPSKLIDSSGLVHSTLTLTLPTGAITTSEIVLAFKDHVMYMNNTENGADVPQRVSWTNIGSVTDHLTGTSGFQDLVDDESWIIAAEILSENEIAIYKERSIVQCIWVGGHTPFRFTTILIGEGAVNKESVIDQDGIHVVVGENFIYRYNGTSQIQQIDENINKTLYQSIDGTYINRLFILQSKQDNEIQIWIPKAQSTPDEGWTLNLQDKSWYIKDRNISTWGLWEQQTALTIGDLVGTIGDQNYTFGSTITKKFTPLILVGDVNGKIYKLDYTTFDNAGTAITNIFETPDYVIPDQPEYMNHFMRVGKLIYEAYGQSITTHYSTDGGLSWSPTMGGGKHIQTLTSFYNDYEQFFETDCKKIRFRFMNVTVSSGFNLRYFGFMWKLKTGRR